MPCSTGDGEWAGTNNEVTERLRERTFQCEDAFPGWRPFLWGLHNCGSTLEPHIAISHQDARQVSLCELLFGQPEGLTLTPPKGVTFGALRTPKRLRGIDY